MTQTIQGIALLLAGAAPVLAQQADSAAHGSEPAGFFVLVLGLAALLLGMRNLRELRHKRMMPPHPEQIRRQDRNTGPQPESD